MRELVGPRHNKTPFKDGLLARQSSNEFDSALASLRHCQGVNANHYTGLYTDNQL